MMSPRRRAPRPVAGALAGIVEGLQPQTPLAAVQRVWTEAVGEAVAREAEPVSERGGVVTIGCSSSIWAAELNMMQADLLAGLARELGDLAPAGLRFVTSGGDRAFRP
ncbi:MAG: hypothetical protein QOJ38_917 [Solirubrobacterales bacterium]|jgi:predicted nucleic acid-binding Zn ribbon protein|nr:hypothetical protein [Solirubrobacterales bacterium]